jgi:hypothetical protein
MANLEELKAKVDTLAAKIVELKKANPVDKDAVGTAVKDLLDAKRTYAQNNNGIGVDGKEWQEPMSKAEKKKLEKAKKAAANAEMVNGKQVRHVRRKPKNVFENMMITTLSIVHPKNKVTLCLRTTYHQNRYLILDKYNLQNLIIF